MKNKKPIHTPSEFGSKLTKDQSLQSKKKSDLMDVYHTIQRSSWKQHFVFGEISPK
jgi:hypothetical protein